MRQSSEDIINKCKEIRRFVWDKTYEVGTGHLGGTFSCVEILVSLYYSGLFTPNQDKFIIGKGHAFMAIYYILADIGIIDKRHLLELEKDGRLLGNQLDVNSPGIDYSTGSLGHAIGVACGLSIARKDIYSVALVGDGECEEGSIWESLVFASRNNIRNIIVIVDRNKLSVTSVVEDYGFYNACKAIGWNVDFVNGHCINSLIQSLTRAKKTPTMIVADTIKGKGVSLIENDAKWHNSGLTKELYEKGLVEIGYS